MTDPADCGPVTLAFCQDVQAEAFDWPAEFFAPKEWHRRRPRPGVREVKVAADAIRSARRPLIVAGGGVLYSGASDALKDFAEKHNIPVGETQAGKSSMPWHHPLNLGSIGVTGSSATNAVAEEADVIVAVGTRLQDFTTGSWALFKHPDRRIVAINVTPYDAHKHNALPLIADAKLALEEISGLLGDWRAPDVGGLKAEWTAAVDAVTAAPQDTNALPTDMQVIGAVQRNLGEDAIVVCAAGGLPGELHKLWRTMRPNGYHLEYGFSTMGYEIAGGLGVKMAYPDREVVVMVGDGSYMMLNSELATSVMLGWKIIVVLLDNRGFGCIDRLQLATGGASFNNLLDTARHEVPSAIDFVAHAAAMGATAEKVGGIAELEAAMARARASARSYLIAIDTDPMPTTQAGGHWWDVAVPEVSSREAVRAARKEYEARRELQRLVD
jgi:3D-(3,5/4)-trihydroxycyclohexane-1,2-dione acylhydrolase (decyclizing)